MNMAMTLAELVEVRRKLLIPVASFTGPPDRMLSDAAVKVSIAIARCPDLEPPYDLLPIDIATRAQIGLFQVSAALEELVEVGLLCWYGPPCKCSSSRDEFEEFR